MTFSRRFSRDNRLAATACKGYSQTVFNVDRGVIMPDTLRALLISGGILLTVVVLITFISIAAVNRGEKAMHDDAASGGHGRQH
jgi:hypothetical protein